MEGIQAITAPHLIGEEPISKIHFYLTLLSNYMKILVIPDIHGLDTWQNQVYRALNFTNDTHIIFLGDYVDSFDIPLHLIEKNLKSIINLKKKFPDRITCLLGNHDYAYIFGKMSTSGFQASYWDRYKEIFNSNWRHFNLAWGYTSEDGKYTLLTHAGLTKSFYDDIVKEIEAEDSIMHNILVDEAETPWKELPLHELLNYFIDKIDLLWKIGPSRTRGYSPNLTGSIVWADKSELIKYAYPGINQIVGHTNEDYIDIRKLGNDTLYFIDVHTNDRIIGFNIEL